ncbi:DUF4440 domain-containing protein [Amnibacterium flavum]|uniref:DUF4440 domain-containing protein n=1 Tax=Amnibacterium flavum TaxID=2173173 RepID=A0A2V1HX91_9MICO|nr:nuclear transport factor 2 family protein [Amnibacterium flavum]PVZ95870.1 DUF4440 domain-containing protein [Amnibacterium flavum]
MWEAESAAFALVKEAEQALLRSAVRGDKEQLASLLSPDFAEIGRSGRRWTSDEIVEALEAEEPRPAPGTSEWLYNQLGPDLVLVQFRVHRAEGDSRHTSLWDTSGHDGSVMRFHPGTPVLPSG